MKLNKYLKEDRRWTTVDDKHNRIGLVHYIYKGDKTVSVDEDVSPDDQKKIIKEFERLESEIYNIIDNKIKEFDLFLDKNNFESSMGTIGHKRNN
jgi:hypothetical protein